jgi:D-alanyl-lipoteichoic acid acyltransferase DltB (MBOAT superfamily)
MIILHYGLNLATNIRNDYSYYEKGLARQISLIHEVYPGTAVVVVGLTDIAYLEGDRVVPYPNIGKIIRAQEKAAGEAGAVFWDARTAMGGNSSIIRWFGMDPPLAKKDYVHFTDQGADTLAALMLSDLFTIKQIPLPDSLTAVRQPDRKTDTLVAAVTTPVPIQQNEEENIMDTLIQTVLRYDPSSPFIFSSPSFWVFFLFVLGGFLFVYRKMFLRNLYLFIVSLLFYYKSGGLFLILLILVTVIAFSCGLFINRSESKAGRRFFLLLSIISNIGLLAYFKYTGFLIQTFNDLFGTAYVAKDYLQSFSNQHFGTHFNISSIILPVGISFFTFQSLSYTIDVYRRKLEPVRNIIDFGFYVSFFPQLVAGPIVRASEFIPQLYKPYNVTQREMSHAIFLIMKGLIKKIIISDFIAVNFVDRIFDLPTAHSGFENLMAIYGYGLQIYCDFSGYTDIAIGLGLILGFRLPLNFNSPYKAVNVADFWKRWHISLSRWLKDYLYIPLGGNRKGKFRTIINLMITMLLGGLWHGASMRFVVWGGLHGIALAFNKILNFMFGDRTARGRIRSAVSVFLTFQFVSFCWIFFRAQDLQTVTLMLRQIINDFLPSSFESVFTLFGGAFALIAAGYFIHFLPEKIKESYRGLFIRIPVAAQMVIVLMIAFLLYQMRSIEIMPFIYCRF